MPNPLPDSPARGGITPDVRRWIIVAIIFGALMLSYIDRVTISFLEKEIKEMFNLNNTGYAAVANIFIIFYAIMYPVSGWLIEKFGHGKGVHRFMFGGIMLWSVACGSAVLTRVAWTFGICRAVLGFAEPMAYAVHIRVMTEWFPKKLRATANNISAAGGTIGMVVAAPLLVGLKETYDWRAAFVVPAILGIIIAFLWLAFYRNPSEAIRRENTGGAADSLALTWPQLWRTRTLWGIVLIRFISDPVWYFCLFWLPYYLKHGGAGLSEKQVGMFGFIPFLIAAFGSIGAGMVSDYMVRKGVNALRARKILLTVVACFMPVFSFTPFIRNPAIVIAIFSVVCAVCLTWMFLAAVCLTETLPSRNTSSALGIAAGFGAIGSVIFNQCVGRAFDTIGPVPIFAVMGVLHLIAVGVLWPMMRHETPPGQKPRPAAAA
jgi:ACS family hexuronate transporter-like MFS transporter